MDIINITGLDKGNIMIYALSTCGWCKKTKEFLKESNIAYQFVDVDLLDQQAQQQAITEIKKWNPACSFPTMIINNESCIIGFNIDKIKETLDL
jgi:glutaredoxin-like protein NrdH